MNLSPASGGVFDDCLTSLSSLAVDQSADQAQHEACMDSTEKPNAKLKRIMTHVHLTICSSERIGPVA